MFEGLFGKIFSLLWQNIFALGHVIIVLNDQILNKYYSHLVTLLLTYLLVYAKFLSSHCRKRKRKLKTFSTKYTFLNKKYLPPKVDNFPVLNCFLLFIVEPFFLKISSGHRPWEGIRTPKSPLILAKVEPIRRSYSQLVKTKFTSSSEGLYPYTC